MLLLTYYGSYAIIPPFLVWMTGDRLDRKGAAMPAVTMYYPRGFFDSTDKARFRRDVKQSVAGYMDAIDPATGERTKYGADPDAFIDLVLIPYDPDDAEVTTPLLGTIVTYEWPDRIVNLRDRINAITNEVRRSLPTELVPRDQEAISFTFLGKMAGAWAVA